MSFNKKNKKLTPSEKAEAERRAANTAKKSADALKSLPSIPGSKKVTPDHKLEDRLKKAFVKPFERQVKKEKKR